MTSADPNIENTVPKHEYRMMGLIYRKNSTAKREKKREQSKYSETKHG
jgi:hypothetical protein